MLLIRNSNCIEVFDILAVNVFLGLLVMPNHRNNGCGIENAQCQGAQVDQSHEGAWRAQSRNLIHHKPHGKPNPYQQRISKYAVIAEHFFNPFAHAVFCIHRNFSKDFLKEQFQFATLFPIVKLVYTLGLERMQP